MNYLFKGTFGLEREAIRISSMAEISKRNHPNVFNEHHPYITKDFAEAQIEMITPPCDRIDDAILLMEDIQQVVIESLEDGEMLWKQSNPPIINKMDGISIAKFSDDPDKEAYREYLLEKYGIEKSIISGVHYNFSFDEMILKDLYELSKVDFTSYHDFKNQMYLKVTKYILKHRWMFIYLTNASPVFHNSYYELCVGMSEQLNSGDCIIDGLNSLRNSSCGYRNKEDIILDFKDYASYRASVQEVIRMGQIRNESELYTPVRLKEDKDGNISYLELRFIDVNPFTQSGISDIDLKYIHLHMIYALMLDDFDFNTQEQVQANALHNEISMGLEDKRLHQEMLSLHKTIETYFKDDKSPYDLNAIFSSIQSRLMDVEQTYAAQLKRRYQQSSYIDYHLEQSIYETHDSKLNQFTLYSDNSLELSTKILIKEAIKEGYLFNILDSKSNFIKLTDVQSQHSELIQQATKTNLDDYANVLAMENKVVTKKLLLEQRLSTPTGFEIHYLEELNQYDLTKYVNHGVVIKPNTTNFGDGITIYPQGADEATIYEAVKFAFTYDETVLVEPFIQGKEYRFLVIGKKVIGVLYRQAAHVVGDGNSSIKTLVELKNQNPLRGNDYVRPLERIQLGAKELEFLSLQDYSIESIPENGEMIYLRENSNISTGGDSVDVTDDVHESYFTIAEQAAQALGVNITGVDIIIKDIEVEATDSNYSILELNYNPAIHIHTFPLIGKNRMPAKYILKHLFELK